MSNTLQTDTVANNTPIAFFDFDGTLTTGDTLMPFLKFVVGWPRYYWNLLLVSPVLIGYFLKLIRNDKAKEAVLKRYLAGYSIAELFRLGERFSAEIIPAMLRPEALTRLRWHQAQGHDCVLVSASFDVWLTFVGEDLKLSQVISSELHTHSQTVDGHIKGANCHGPEKVNRIRSWLKTENRTPSVTYAYGDSSGDSEMLNMVDKRFFIKSRHDFMKVNSLS